jgi:energy-coupling factor transporter ATP-binding protein EcfA2
MVAKKAHKVSSAKPTGFQLKAISYSELDQFNLIVGKNSTGKSRFLKSINGLTKLLTGSRKQMWDSGSFDVELRLGESLFRYALEVSERAVKRESLTVDGEARFERGADGAGEILAEEVGKPIKFQVERNALVAQVKNDAIQHPFLNRLNKWAAGVRMFEFGTPLGRDHLMVAPGVSGPGAVASSDALEEQTLAVKVVHEGLQRFGDEYKNRLLKDLGEFGFPCTDVGVAQLPNVQANTPAPPLLGIFVVERGLNFKNFQLHISQGFFRALSLMANLNLLQMKGIEGTVLIDDIGEGLDYERASGVVKALMRLSRTSRLQLVMTSNDRFIMNAVPLECWTVLDRAKGRVRSFNVHNARARFEEFRYLGLSNFDFFASHSYKKSLTK